MTERTATNFWAIFTAFLGFAIILFCYLVDPSSILIDDKEGFFFPGYFEMGRMLHNGEFPFLTSRMLNGGNFTAEYQYSLFNPVALLSYYLLPIIANTQIAALLLTGFYHAVLAAGLFKLAKTYALSDLGAVVVSITVSAGSYLLYWFVASWFVGLTSFAWASWAMYFARQVIRTQRVGDQLGFVTFTTLVITAGFHFSNLAVGFFVLALAVFAIREGRNNIAGVLSLGFASAILLSVISMMSIFLGAIDTGRPLVVGALPETQLPLGSFITSSVPFMSEVGVFFGKLTYAYPSQFHFAWYLLPTVLLFDLSILRKTGAAREAAILTAVFLFSTQLPDFIGYLKMPARFIPYLTLFLAITLVSILEHSTPNKYANKFGPRILLVGWVVVFHLILYRSAITGTLVILGTLIMVYANYEFLRYCKQREKTRFHIAAMLVIILSFAIQHYSVATGDTLPKLGLSVNQNVLRELPSSQPYSLYLGRELNADNIYGPKNAGLLRGEKIINGYGHLTSFSFTSTFCMSRKGYTCDNIRPELFLDTFENADNLLKLLNVDRIIIHRDRILPNLKPVVADQWRETPGSESWAVFERESRDVLPGTLSWHAPGIEIESTARFYETQEKFRITKNKSGGRIVFSRIYYPGYEARIDGTALSIEPLGDFLVSLDVPAGLVGEITLIYRPPMFVWGAIAGLIGLVITVLTCFYLARLDKNQAT